MEREADNEESQLRAATELHFFNTLASVASSPSTNFPSGSIRIASYPRDAETFQRCHIVDESHTPASFCHPQDVSRRFNVSAHEFNHAKNKPTTLIRAATA
jgi:hypothetical protein